MTELYCRKVVFKDFTDPHFMFGLDRERCGCVAYAPVETDFHEELEQVVNIFLNSGAAIDSPVEIVFDY